MKRKTALAEIRQCGFHKDVEGAAIIKAKKGIGSAAARKAYTDGVKAKEWGELCDCAKCTASREGK